MTNPKHAAAVLAYVTARCAMRVASDRYDRTAEKAARQAMTRANVTADRAAWPSIDAACGFMEERRDLTDPSAVMVALGYDQAARIEASQAMQPAPDSQFAGAVLAVVMAECAKAAARKAGGIWTPAYRQARNAARKAAVPSSGAAWQAQLSALNYMLKLDDEPTDAAAVMAALGYGAAIQAKARKVPVCITVRYSSIDGCSERRTFKTLAGARAYAVRYVGEQAEPCGFYAVSDDGVGKITVEGCTLAELFARPVESAAPADQAPEAWNQANAAADLAAYDDECPF